MLNFCYNFLKQTGIGGISMTFEQMKCAIEIASCGSISKESVSVSAASESEHKKHGR